ncbi:hypothetical protein [Streptomyces acidiscabies]|uniref:Uncharacterized protein n=1 Tax=Streptomyces acidiscabies TaxID=42234 RepID=A0ABU4LYP4_9ACTN|nr:hypothetical protein [Streptomyces acidiscabies]MDX3020032.1 hypothetical protein [Streptomyces acidiscabies]
MTAAERAPAPDRAVPVELIDLAERAIRAGSPQVRLLHESLGYDFPAPIGWILGIAGPDWHHGEYFSLTHQIGCSIEETLAEAPAWLKHAPADAPVINELAELFRRAVQNGWGAVYEAKRQDAEMRNDSLRGLAEEHGRPVVQFPVWHELRCRATNWDYDEEARAAGAPVSTEVTLSANEGQKPDRIAFADGTRIERATARQMLAEPAPWSVPVAFFDEEHDRWQR